MWARLVGIERGLTNTSSGGREASFVWLVGVLCGGPLTRGVRRAEWVVHIAACESSIAELESFFQLCKVVLGDNL
jgi:hypothetical protein